MHQKYLQQATVSALLMSCTAVQALPFNSFDPRSMAMGGTGVAIGDPGTAPFFNPALLTASDPSKKFSVELPIIGGRLYDPGNLRNELTTLSDNANALQTATTPLSSSASTLTTNTTTLTTDITTLTNNITALAAYTTINASNATAASTALSTVSTNLTTVTNDMTTVSGNMTTVSNNATTVNSNLSKVNQSLQAINNQPLQGEFGAATVVAVPGKNYGLAFYADAWGAAGGELIYKDATTISNISGAITTTSTALNSSSTATSSSATKISTAATDVNTAASSCTAAAIQQAGTYTTCTNALTAANNSLANAKTSVSSTSTTLATNATTVTNAAATATNNKTMLSQIHLRGVAVKEMGFSISHGFVTNDHAWSLGITPKIMQLQLYDLLLSANNGTSTNIAGSDYLASYSTMNVDVGVAKSYINGWRTGVVVKNAIPQSFDFKRAPTPGATPIATGDTLSLNPQFRGGISHENAWSTVALDVDLTRNNPAGLENYSQFVSLGGELSAYGWAQIRTGYRYDLLNPAQRMASLGFGLSPRIPYFKPHFDFAITASPDIFTNGWNSASQVGAALKLGMNF